MNKNKDSTLNASGYKDLTAHKALCNVRREEKRAANIKADSPRVYICSPFAGDTEINVKNALRYCRFAIDKGKMPIAPHCYFPQFLDDDNPNERELGISFGLRMLGGCRELWVFGSRISDGMKREILAARHRNIRIRQFDEDCEEL
jgi:hypothetical protein